MSISEKLISLVEEQLKGYQQIHNLLRKQKDAICSSNTKELHELIDEQERVSIKLLKIKEEISSIKRRFEADDIREVVDAPRKKRVEDLLEETDVVIHQIINLEEENQLVLKNKMEEIGEKIQVLRKMKKLNKMYRKRREALFIDKYL
jgi:flagellar biosynthesis/type III secretory pathway chaperone